MSLVALAAALALSLVDPTGDAAGDGTLEPPTSPVYARAALFDLQELRVTEGQSEGEPAELRVAMGAVEVDGSQPAGFNRAVVDVYLDFVDGGADATLSGPGMLMPPGRGWDYAVRVSPRGAFGAPAPLDDDQVMEWTPLELALDGDVFVVSLPAEVPAEVDAYGVSGVYDAFSRDSWRPLASSPSPWSYSGTEQVVPVIDVVASDHDTQMRALRAGVLPAPSRQAADGLPWLLLSMAGVLIAALGLWLRRLVGASTAAEVSFGDMDEAVAETAHQEFDHEPETETEFDEPVVEGAAVGVDTDTDPDADAPVAEDADFSSDEETVEDEETAEDAEIAEDAGYAEEDAFGRVGSELSDPQEEDEDELLGFVASRGRSLRVENSDAENADAENADDEDTDTENADFENTDVGTPELENAEDDGGSERN